MDSRFSKYVAKLADWRLTETNATKSPLDTSRAAAKLSLTQYREESIRRNLV
jgi:hypothetical protein